jgi:hypothetical protein
MILDVYRRDIVDVIRSKALFGVSEDAFRRELGDFNSNCGDVQSYYEKILEFQQLAQEFDGSVQGATSGAEFLERSTDWSAHSTVLNMHITATLLNMVLARFRRMSYCIDQLETIQESLRVHLRFIHRHSMR